MNIKMLKQGQKIVIASLSLMFIPILFSLWMIHSLGEISDTRVSLYRDRNILEAIDRALSDIKINKSGLMEPGMVQTIDSELLKIKISPDDKRADTIESVRDDWEFIKGQQKTNRSDIKSLRKTLDRAISYEQSIFNENTPRLYLLYDTVALSLLSSILFLCALIFYIFYRVRITNEEFFQLTSSLKERTDEALSASKIKSQFLATISHEIRTPLNGIIGMSSLMQKEPMSENLEKKVKIVKDSAEVLLGIVSDILDYSRIEEKGVSINPRPFELEHLVEHMVALKQRKAENKNLHFSVTKNYPTDLWVIGDEVKMSQVIMNLLNNAIKFTSEGKVDFEITSLESSKGKMELKFKISDTGIGMGQEEMKNIFSPFTQEHKVGTSGEAGAGLGLSISKSIVTGMGGQILVDSHPGRGSSFSFTVELQASTNNSKVQIKPKTYQHLKALIVEDNPINQQVALLTLKHLGIGATIVSNGQEALDYLQQSEVDIIFMDCQMPVMDGFEATLAIRKKGSLVPIIAMTANYSTQEKMSYSRSGMDDVLLKPFSIPQMTAIIEKYSSAAA